MRREDFAEVLGDIDEKYIQEAETMRKSNNTVWLKCSAMVACFCLLLATVAVIPQLFLRTTPIPPDNSDVPVQTTPDQSEDSEQKEDQRTPWTAYFNEATSRLDANRAYIKGYFTEPLNDTELAVLEPEMHFAYMNCSGYAGFDNYGNLLEVVLSVTTSLPENPVTIAITDYSFGSSYVLSGEEVVSVCEKVEYRVYQYEVGNTVTLTATASINDLYFHFAMDVTSEQLERAKADFQCVLECFATYEAGKPDLSVITPEEIPELMEQIFHTLAEAQAEPDFGQYMPSALPAGFEESTIRRFQFQNSNYLSGLWSKGLDDLAWVVSPYAEADAHRLTSVEDKENYDLALYPIPRADSVPDELREIVDNPIFDAEELTLEAVYRRAYKVNDAGDTDGWRMEFSVKYGDVVVTVRAKGVTPEWVYQQLMLLNTASYDVSNIFA